MEYSNYNTSSAGGPGQLGFYSQASASEPIGASPSEPASASLNKPASASASSPENASARELIPSLLPVTVPPSPPAAAPAPVVPGKPRGVFLSRGWVAALSAFMVLTLGAAGMALGLTLTEEGAAPTAVDVAREFVNNPQLITESNTDTVAVSNQEADAVGIIQNAVGQIPNTANEPSSADGSELPLSQRFLPRSLSTVVEDLLPSAVTIYYSIPNTSLGGTGSGVIYDRSGLIITAAHVVTLDNASLRGVDTSQEEVLIELNSGDVVRAEIVGFDRAIDIAVLRFDPTGLEFEVAETADLSQTEAGDIAIAVGSPYGLTNSVNVGFISSVNRSTQASFDFNSRILVPAIQTDAPINSGNSGGMLANIDGEVLGINVSIQTTTSAFGDSAGNLGIGFAVPMDLATRVANKILLGEQFIYGSLGITGSANRQEGTGAFVAEIVADSPAAVGGLQPDDRIVGYNSEKIIDMSDLITKVQFTEPGTQVTLEVVRDGVPVRVFVTITQSEIPSETTIN